MCVINYPSHLSPHTHTPTCLAYLTQGARGDTDDQHEQTLQLCLGKTDPAFSLHPHPPRLVYTQVPSVCAPVAGSLLTGG